MYKNLSTININEVVTISSISESILKPKLIEMGLTQDRKLKVLFKAPFNGPIAIDLGDWVLSLGLDEAKLINIK